MDSNNCIHGEVEFNAHCRVTIDVVSDCPLKDGTNTFENLSYPGSSLAVSYTDVVSYIYFGNCCSEKKKF